ncbi:NAD-dependent epimerase/dehydratase family protein [Janthinobacterium sp. PSPC1-1]|uniref:NAD-dependent epimerase/dehydratase family protein n=1 Tax=Janthinobacterium sp. PSPC1-1 TaxID=2804581 RepID=UPI003CEB9617
MKLFITGATGFVGGSVARRLIEAGHSVRGLVRDSAKAEQLKAIGITPVLGTLEDHALLVSEAKLADGVINMADSDHMAAIESFIEGLTGSNKPLLHTSGSSVIGDDARGLRLNEAIFDEDTPLLIDPAKQPRRDVDLRVLRAGTEGVRGVVICPSNIYGTGTGLTPVSFQIPFLVNRARENGVVRIVGTGVNRWSNVHIDDVAELFLLAVEKAPAGAFYFIENGEDSFADIGAAIARRMQLGPVEFVSAEEAAKEWGEMHAFFTFGTNSRVRAKRARCELGWTPRHSSALAWIEQEMPV